MSLRLQKVGSTDVSVVIRIVDSGDGTPEQGVDSNTSGLALWYRVGGGTKTAITPSDLSALDDAHSDGGMLHIDDGYYRLDIPDAACSSDVEGVLVGGTATGMVVIGAYLQLTDAMGDLWGTRTLTQNAASVTATLSGDTITVLRGDTLSVSMTGLGDISSRTKLWFTVKEKHSDTDANSIIQIEETAGLVYFNKAAGTSGNGSITVDDENDGDITVALAAADTDDLALVNDLVYDVQMLTATGVTTLTSGTLDVSGDVTRVVS